MTKTRTFLFISVDDICYGVTCAVTNEVCQNVDGTATCRCGDSGISCENEKTGAYCDADNNVCKCNADTAACSGDSDTCTGGQCLCGGDDPCTGDETCQSGVCKCGGADESCKGKATGSVCDAEYSVCKCSADVAACSGEEPQCVSGVCFACSTDEQCTVTSDTCSNGMCKCGTEDACSNNGETCVSGVCMCGSADSCFNKNSGSHCDHENDFQVVNGTSGIIHLLELAVNTVLLEYFEQ